MAHPFTTPVLAGGLVLAVAGGMHLGNSAIDLIDPIHFRGPAVHPRDRGAAIDPNQVQASEPAFASLYGWQEGHAARAEDCGGCEAVAARDAYAYPDGAVLYRAVGDGWEPLPAPEIEEAAADLAETADRWEKVTRYAYYEVEAAADTEGGWASYDE